MIETLASLFICAFLIVYWVLCRENALKQQIIIVKLMDDFVRTYPEDKKNLAYLKWNYRCSRRWVFLPVIMIVLAAFCLVTIVRRECSKVIADKGSPTHIKSIESAILLMYVKRNPLTSIASFLVFAISIAFLYTAGAVFNRMDTMRCILSDVGSSAMSVSGNLKKLQA